MLLTSITFVKEFFCLLFSPDDVWKIITESTWELFYVNNELINIFNNINCMWIIFIICVFHVVCWWNFGEKNNLILISSYTAVIKLIHTKTRALFPAVLFSVVSSFLSYF